jgi:hypothetical protein
MPAQLSASHRAFRGQAFRVRVALGLYCSQAESTPALLSASESVSPHERHFIEDLNAIEESLVELPEPKPKKKKKL